MRNPDEGGRVLSGMRSGDIHTIVPRYNVALQDDLAMYTWGGCSIAVGEKGHAMGSMKRTERILQKGALAAAGVAVLLVCCAASNDAVSNAEKSELHKPGIAETKAIAEEGFIYGLPI